MRHDKLLLLRKLHTQTQTHTKLTTHTRKTHTHTHTRLTTHTTHQILAAGNRRAPRGLSPTTPRITPDRRGAAPYHRQVARGAAPARSMQARLFRCTVCYVGAKTNVSTARIGRQRGRSTARRRACAACAVPGSRPTAWRPPTKKNRDICTRNQDICTGAYTGNRDAGRYQKQDVTASRGGTKIFARRMRRERGARARTPVSKGRPGGRGMQA